MKKKHFIVVIATLIFICIVIVISLAASNSKVKISSKVELKVISYKDIEKYLYMTKDETLQELGKQYEIVETGAEGVNTGYFYKMLGITITFNDNEEVAWIDCNDKVSINGAKAGMNFNQIQEILGKTSIKESWVDTPENKSYEISFQMNKGIVFFRSYYEDGRESEVFIVPN